MTAVIPSGRRIVLRIEYDGAAFGGWQKQSSEIPTVQGVLEPAISRVADAPVKLVCAGRTDAGVHATCQIAHFDRIAERSPRAWKAGVNSFLPKTVKIQEVCTATSQFSARFSATGRRYAYLLHPSGNDSPQLAGRALRVDKALDLDAMRAAARCLEGEKDFRSFQAAGCQSLSSLRDVRHLRIYRQRGFIVIDIRANAFLQHMVRIIAGSLLEVGRSRREPDWMAQVLAARDRKQAGATAPAAGLYLTGVAYPASCGVPSRTVAPPLLDRLPEFG